VTQSHCIWCDEVLLPSDTRHTYANGPSAHRACALRQVVGSVAHLERRCSCYVPGATEGDPDGLTRRAAAEAAVQAFMRLGQEALDDD